MKTKFYCAVSFAIGGISGFLFANHVLKEKYDKIVEEEVESIKASFRKYQIDQEAEKESEEEIEAVKQEYEELVDNLGYDTISEDMIEEIPEPNENEVHHMIISEDQFGKIEDYETITLLLLQDGVMVDDDYDRMSDEEIQWAIGDVDLKAFAKSDAETMYIRNNRIKVYYEIVKDDQTYAEIVQSKPYLAW
jgi:hypothetical protein